MTKKEAMQDTFGLVFKPGSKKSPKRDPHTIIFKKCNRCERNVEIKQDKNINIEEFSSGKTCDLCIEKMVFKTKVLEWLETMDKKDKNVKLAKLLIAIS